MGAQGITELIAILTVGVVGFVFIALAIQKWQKNVAVGGVLALIGGLFCVGCIVQLIGLAVGDEEESSAPGDRVVWSSRNDSSNLPAPPPSPPPAAPTFEQDPPENNGNDLSPLPADDENPFAGGSLSDDDDDPFALDDENLDRVDQAFEDAVKKELRNSEAEIAKRREEFERNRRESEERFRDAEKEFKEELEKFNEEFFGGPKLPKYAVNSFEDRGRIITAIVLVTPESGLPTEDELRGIWGQLKNQTPKRLNLKIYLPGMNVDDQPWITISQSGNSVNLRRYDDRLPAGFR